MMYETLMRDCEDSPLLFFFFGPIPSDVLLGWIEKNSFKIPSDLAEFWSKTGGCDLFEGETILGPFGSVYLGDNVKSTTQDFWNRGMSSDYLIFRIGLGGCSVLIQSKQLYANINKNSFAIDKIFKTLESWYSEFLRVMYLDIYKLPKN